MHHLHQVSTARTRWPLAVLLALLVQAAPGGDAAAEPTVNLSWSFCSSAPLTSRSIGPGDQAGVYTSVRGHEAPHLGYRLAWILRTPDPGFPDAWRFDADGCQGTDLLTINPRGPVTFTRCFDFAGASAWTASTRVEFDASAGTLRIELDHDYSPLVVPSVDQTYFLARVLFDHTWSSVESGATMCSGIDRPVCIALAQAGWIDEAGELQAWPIGSGIVSASPDGGPVECAAVPATRGTWGTIKAQYRN